MQKIIFRPCHVMFSRFYKISVKRCIVTDISPNSDNCHPMGNRLDTRPLTKHSLLIIICRSALSKKF